MRTCSKCILSITDDPKIVFDENGICNHCKIYDENLKKYYKGDEVDLHSFNSLIKRIKEENRNNKYDVLIGLSGGVDSTYVALLCKTHNLRAFAVHLDNGWNSELSVVNIKNILKYTGFDLYTHVINWKEFRDLQRSYFKANVVDIEALTDHAISALMIRKASKLGIKYILSGSSITTEGRLPDHWVHTKSDAINIRSIHKKFGSIPIKTFPIMGERKRKQIINQSGIEFLDILDYIPYNKPQAKKEIKNEFKWRDYGGKHYESVFTRFYQAYILPEKFNIDKRKSHYSTLICAEQMNRNEALELMKKAPYESESLKQQDKEFVLKKLGFTEEEFENYIQSPRVEHLKYRSSQKLRRSLSKVKRSIIGNK